MAQVINGEIVGRVGNMTYYQQNGKTIVRASRNTKNKRKTAGQFRQMMEFRNRNLLWKVMKQTEHVYFEGKCPSAQRQFLSVNSNLPHVYIPKQIIWSAAALLQPNMVVSDGPLPSFAYQFGEFQGEPALLTTLAETDAKQGQLLLYVFQQVEKNSTPSINTKVIDLSLATDDVKVTFSDDQLVLTSTMFTDSMSGFALVRIVNGHASRQTLITRCTYYERFTTDEALMIAAESYGIVKEYGIDWKVTLRK